MALLRFVPPLLRSALSCLGGGMLRHCCAKPSSAMPSHSRAMPLPWRGKRCPYQAPHRITLPAQDFGSLCHRLVLVAVRRVTSSGVLFLQNVVAGHSIGRPINTVLDVFASANYHFRFRRFLQIGSVIVHPVMCRASHIRFPASLKNHPTIGANAANSHRAVSTSDLTTQQTMNITAMPL